MSPSSPTHCSVTFFLHSFFDGVAGARKGKGVGRNCHRPTPLTDQMGGIGFCIHSPISRTLQEQESVKGRKDLSLPSPTH